MTKNSYKGKKMYGVMCRPDSSTVLGPYNSIENAVRCMDKEWNIVVELTVTRVFTRERDIKEIENEL